MSEKIEAHSDALAQAMICCLCILWIVSTEVISSVNWYWVCHLQISGDNLFSQKNHKCVLKSFSIKLVTFHDFWGSQGLRNPATAATATVEGVAPAGVAGEYDYIYCMNVYDFIIFIPAKSEFNQLDLQWFLDSFGKQRGTYSIQCFPHLSSRVDSFEPFELGNLTDWRWLVHYDIHWLQYLVPGTLFNCLGGKARSFSAKVASRWGKQFCLQRAIWIRSCFLVQLWLWIYITVGWHLRWVAWQSALLQPRHG